MTKLLVYPAQSFRESEPSQFSLVQSLSRFRLFATPWIAACQASLSITNSRSSLKLTSIKLVMPSSHLILGRPLLLVPSIPPSISLFQWVNSSHEVAKILEFQSQHQSCKEHPGLISFRMDWLELLAGQGTLKSLLQLCSSKASILRHSAFFTVQLSHPNMTTGKTMAVNSLMFKLVLEKAEEPEIKLPTSTGSWKKQESSKKNLLLLYCLCQSLWLCGSQ